ncbi:MAG: hypothetical protein F6K40_12990 [Okeania sp. SIO3I5]|nr:hypothetical protein [Okeania sp. SIO3I5]
MTVPLYAIEEIFDYPSPLAGCFRKCIDCCSIRNKRKISLLITSGWVLHKMYRLLLYPQ